jgi:hypothetical protein
MRRRILHPRLPPRCADKRASDETLTAYISASGAGHRYALTAVCERAVPCTLRSTGEIPLPGEQDRQDCSKSPERNINAVEFPPAGHLGLGQLRIVRQIRQLLDLNDHERILAQALGEAWTCPHSTIY